jgi:predicted GH43/DUF377 family glycosyl hydrolase
VFKWKKLGKVFDPTTVINRVWLHEYAQAPATLIFDDFVRVYFSCRPKKDENGQYVSYSAYVDLNRKNLFKVLRIAEKPILSLGSRGCFDEFGTYPFSVIRMGGEVWGYYGGWTRCSSVPFIVQIGVARSKDDGKTFQRIGEGPILSISPDEPSGLGSPKIRKFNGKYYLFYVATNKWVVVNGKPEISHKIRMAISDNGLNWVKYNQDLIPDSWGEYESQASPGVFWANDKYHMFFDGWVPTSFRQTKIRKIGYAYSRDLVNWIRDDSKAGIDISERDSFDNEMVAYPHVFELDGKIYMLYLGNEVGRYGFGLAELEGELK